MVVLIRLPSRPATRQGLLQGDISEKQKGVVEGAQKE
jgi:hypothetical protein